MIKDRNSFFGRTEELQRVFDRLWVMQAISVVGERRIGKSSFLYHITLIGQEELSEGYAFHYIDMQRVVTDAEFFERAVRRLGGSGNTHLNLEQAIADKRVVLCLDEFEKTAGNPNFDVDFFNALRSLAQTGELTLIVATQTPLPELSYTGAIKTSPFFNIFAPLPLGPLKPDEARVMLAEMSIRGGLSFTDGEIEWAIQMTDAHPWRLQVLASHLFEAKQQGKPDLAKVEHLYREETLSGKRPRRPPRRAQGPSDRRQRLAPWVAILTAATAFSFFFFASVSNVYGVYFALFLAAVTIGVTVWAFWPFPRRSP
jgi:hypothetical protein